MKRYLIFERRGRPIGAILYSEQTERDARRRLVMREVRRSKSDVVYEVLGIRAGVKNGLPTQTSAPTVSS